MSDIFSPGCPRGCPQALRRLLLKCQVCRESSELSACADEKLTLAGEVRPEPLGRGVVEETLGVGEADREVSRVASVLEDSLQRELGRVSRAVVGAVLDTWRVGAVH